MQASMDSEMVRERLEELGEELQTVASLVHLSIKNQQHGVHESAGSFDCSGDAERKFQDLKGEVQTLARVLDSNSSSLASLTADSLADVNRLADQASRCKEAIGALDGLCQAEDFLNSSQSLLAKNEYVQAADAVASAEVLLGDLQRAETASANRGGRAGGGVDKENRRNGSGTGGDSGVLRAVKRLLLKRRAALESHLRDLVQEALQLGPTTRCRKLFSGYLCDRYFRSAVPLVDVFEALGRLGQLDALFSEISEKLRTGVVAPLLSARHVPPPKRVSDVDSASLTYAPAPASGVGAGGASASPGASGFPSKEGGGKEGGPGMVSELLGRVTVVLEFMHEEVLGGRAHLTSAFGLQLMSDPDGLSKILLNKLEDHIPHSAQQLPDFERGARDACYLFEDRLCEMGYYASDNAAPISQQKAAVRGKLCRFVETVDGRFSAKRRRTLLQQARDLALGDYHNTVEVSDALEGGASSDEASSEGVTSAKGSKMGVDGHDKDNNKTQAFRLEACQVSTVASSLVALVRATLAEACSDQIPPHCAKELFRTARDMLDLFRAVVPVQHANALDGVPRIAAVFQNDCLYLAHHMVTLGHEFRHGLPPPANQTATMIDTVHLFRELAAHSFSEQQRRQHRQLQEFFVGVDVLASTEAAASSSSSSSSLHDATTSALEGMFPHGEGGSYPRGRLDARGWMAASGGDAATVGNGRGGGEEGSTAVAVRKSVYHLRQLRQAWCKVLPDRVYKRAMGALLSLVAGKIYMPVMGAQDLAEEQTHALHRIFKTLGEAAQDIFGSPAEAEQYTPGWSKAVVVGQMMELGLEAIGERLQGEGDGLRPLTNDELVGLIRAIFQDNAGRAAILDAITE
ncbi:unnamed protein product [Ectocarpus sp. 6 AP-2014]